MILRQHASGLSEKQKTKVEGKTSTLTMTHQQLRAHAQCRLLRNDRREPTRFSRMCSDTVIIHAVKRHEAKEYTYFSSVDRFFFSVPSLAFNYRFHLIC